MHIFKAKEEVEFNQEFEMKVLDILSEHGCERPTFFFMPSHEGIPSKDKIRVTFNMKDKESSVKVFKYFLENPYIFDNAAKIAIFLQKQESIFVKYGDIEAEKFEKT